MRGPRLHIPGQTCYHHCTGRLHPNLPDFSKRDVREIIELLQTQVDYCGFTLWAYSVSSRRYDVVVQAPSGDAEISDEEFMRRLRLKEYPRKVQYAERLLEEYGPESQEWRQLKCNYMRTMGNLSDLLHRIAVCTSFNYQRRHRRKGKVWKDRAITIPIAEDTESLLQAVAYVDSRPLADGVCREPFRNARNSIAVASRGDEGWRESYRRLLQVQDWSKLTKIYREKLRTAAETPITDLGPRSWGEVSRSHLQQQQRKQKLRGAGRSKKDRERIAAQRLKELEAFKERFGHCNVPSNWSENPQLGIWVIGQRRDAKKGRIPESRRKKLDELGFSWRLRSR